MSKLAIDGGAKAIEGFEGKGQPKIGNEEFLEMARVWGYSQKTIDRVKEVIEESHTVAAPSLVAN